MRILNILSLSEARKNPEQNPKVPALEQIRQYADNPNIYISFTKIDKIGINPGSTYYTPNGIYTYPLKEIFPMMEEAKTVQAVPFAGESPYIWVLEATKPVIDVATYSMSDFGRDYDVLKKLYDAEVEKSSKDWQSFDDLYAGGDGKYFSVEEFPIGALLYMTKSISRINNPKKFNNVWSGILRYIGYYAISDKTGQRLIHENEPIQAVFFFS